MKALNIRIIIIWLTLSSLALECKAQMKWVVPDNIVIQHAGSIGFFSAGFGYTVFKSQRGELDFVFGNVPESKGGPLSILSSKFSYRPFKVRINDKMIFYPANPGMFISYHIGEKFDFSFDKDQYERGYYGWSTAMRGHLSVSNEIKFNVPNHFKSFSIYSEFNASDLYLVSLFYQNNKEWLKADDIIKVGLGIRLAF